MTSKVKPRTVEFTEEDFKEVAKAYNAHHEDIDWTHTVSDDGMQHKIHGTVNAERDAKRKVAAEAEAAAE